MSGVSGMQFRTIHTLINLKGASDEIVDNFKRLIEKDFIGVNRVACISINYDKTKNNIENGPVRIYTTDGTELRLSLTAGYNGSGPNDLCEIIEICKFEFDRNDILSPQEVVTLKYHKDRNIIYQFTDWEGNYVYSF